VLGYVGAGLGAFGGITSLAAGDPQAALCSAAAGALSLAGGSVGTAGISGGGQFALVGGGTWGGSGLAIAGVYGGSAVGVIGTTGSIVAVAGEGSGGNNGIWKYTDPATQKEYQVGPHGKMPRPRDDNESHHGVMSQWMRAIFGNKYNSNEARLGYLICPF